MQSWPRNIRDAVYRYSEIWKLQHLCKFFHQPVYHHIETKSSQVSCSSCGRTYSAHINLSTIFGPLKTISFFLWLPIVCCHLRKTLLRKHAPKVCGGEWQSAGVAQRAQKEALEKGAFSIPQNFDILRITSGMIDSADCSSTNNSSLTQFQHSRPLETESKGLTELLTSRMPF